MKRYVGGRGGRGRPRPPLSSSSSESESSSEDEKKKRKLPRAVDPKLVKRIRNKPKSWARDDDDPGLILPQPAFVDSDEEKEYRELKYEKRVSDFLDAQQNAREIAEESASEDEREFDDAVALAGVDKEEEPEEHPVIERDFTDDAIVFDYQTGKLEMKRPIVPRWFKDYNLFKPDDTVVLNGKRRTGKTFMMRKILYEMRHCFWGGVVFTATKHNGFWQQIVPRRFIHETLNVEVIDSLLRYRAAEIDALQMNFGPEAKDPLYYFVVLDDMVR